MKKGNICRSCLSPQLIEIVNLRSVNNFTISSDGKLIRKPLEVHRCRNCGLIQKKSTKEKQLDLFKDFCSYEITDGQEQVKNHCGKMIPRSKIICEFIEPYITQKGKILDIGTNDGSFLKNFKKNKNQWELYAQDLHNNSEKDLKQIISLNNFFLGDISNVTGKYDLISLIHVFSHVSDINNFLTALKNLMEEKGQVLFQVPYISNSISDFVIGDSINHFSKKSIENILEKYFRFIYIEEYISGELTILASDDIKYKKYNRKEKEFDADLFLTMIDLLKNQKEKVVIFGTSPHCIFCANILGENLECFLDDDKARIGKKIFSRNIVESKNFHENIKVFLPFFDKNTVDKIKLKHSHIKFIDVFQG